MAWMAKQDPGRTWLPRYVGGFENWGRGLKGLGGYREFQGLGGGALGGFSRRVQGIRGF